LKKEWQKLTYDEQRVYEKKAEYLLPRGYVTGKPVKELAKEIYLSKHRLTNIPNQFIL
jgi:hypothetical protein